MPRAKRAKQYRKLMQQYEITFGFRAPYQVVVDSQLIADACRFKMDLVKSLKQTLANASEIKPSITTCSMRHLYGSKSQPGVEAAIELGKTFERRRCGHLPDQYPEPLSELECLASVVDPKSTGINKHHLILASNSQPIRSYMRGIRTVPLIYINRSVMIMEPMSSGSVTERSKEERAKLRAEIVRPGGKRKRAEDDDEDEEKPGAKEGAGGAEGSAEQAKKKKRKQAGPKGPNPLSVKKPKKPKPSQADTPKPKDKSPAPNTKEASTSEGPKRKRKRKAKTAGDGDGADGEDAGPVASEAGGDDVDRTQED